MIILDTNVLSELMKPEPANSVVRWTAAQPAANLYVTSITQAEILHGIMLLPKGKRRKSLEVIVDAMFAEEFGGKIVPFGPESARFYAEIAVARRLTGRPISHFDAQIAAIARAHGAEVATRNVDDFADCRVKLINPWSDPVD